MNKSVKMKLATLSVAAVAVISAGADTTNRQVRGSSMVRATGGWVTRTTDGTRILLADARKVSSDLEAVRAEMQTMLNIPAGDILMATEVDFVNKGGASEMFAGLEMMKYSDCFMKPDLHYWQNHAKNSQAEVDYLKASNGKILPIEVKASTQGSMQSLWIFMRERKLFDGIRTSLENFGHLSYYDKQDDNAERHVNIVPLYALSNLFMTTHEQP